MGKLAQIQSGKNVRFLLLFIFFFLFWKGNGVSRAHTLCTSFCKGYASGMVWVCQRWADGIVFGESVHGVIVGWANRVTHIRPWQHAELLELPNGGHTETVDDIHIIQCLWEREKKGKLSQFRILFLVKRYVVTTPHVSCHLLETIKPPLSNLLSLRRGFN